ncbi:hypothetical protein JCM24511_06458 [Saitozyma sp. JCM 24511]|nr:hypothetical protein JCM24511_06458 [Saitozyma sp. JCM 24511]
MLLALIYLLSLRLAVATPVSPRQAGSTAAPSVPTGSVVPTATIYPSSASSQPVKVVGVNRPTVGYDAYLGIPFAQPPVGDLRFAPPQPANYTNTTVIAQQWSPACPQLKDAAQGFGDVSGSYGIQEDCLYINVFTPEGTTDNVSLPVMFWVYGGGFVSGTASTYDPSVLVAHSLAMNTPFVFVSVNYRPDLFGFPVGKAFADAGVANLGIRDITQGLWWVQENIWAFGGDPTKVTVAGQSAGAGLTSLLYLQQDQGLFRSAIMMSGGQDMTLQNSTADVTPTGYDLLLNLTNCSTTLANASTIQCLRQVPYDALMAAQANVSAAYGPYSISAPSVDGDLIPAQPYDLLQQGKFQRKPFLSGNVKDEGTLFLYQNLTSSDDFTAYAAGLYNNDTAIVEQILQLYPDDPSLGSPFDTGNQTFGWTPENKPAAALFGDAVLQAPRRSFTRAAQAQGMQTWGYLTAQYPPDNLGLPPYAGAFHGDDILYVFGLLPNATAEYATVIDQYMTYWTNFVVFTDPNGQGSNLTQWPSYNGDQKNSIQILGNGTTVIKDDYREEAIAFLFDKPIKVSS